ncbi:hypothetical protein [Fluviicola taffensis]|uniref:hypothetical protein n=1 Tax=Fluviicola taffensis TaxID=191579 RepID=UPI0031381278
MKEIILIITCIVSLAGKAQQALNDSIPIPPLNQQVLDTAVKYGRVISPTYESAVCTEFVIGVLGHFMGLTSQDTINIRIDQPRENLKEVYRQIENGSPYPTGVVYALVSKGKGVEICDPNQVLPGDFVQFWYPNSWGHCGIVAKMDLENKVLWLHSSYPSTEGYGVQPFHMPEYSHFVRLKE